MKNMFDPADVAGVIERINKLTVHSQREWGTMNVGQMFAHCNVTYEMIYDGIHAKPHAFMRFILKSFVKPKIVGKVPYKQNSPTAPQFKVSPDKDFSMEKERLIHYIQRTYELGTAVFEGKESLSFGKLTAKEWNNMFYKHLDHHLKQFGA